jgi:LuxR family maltose regulon positive regulatory protein
MPAELIPTTAELKICAALLLFYARDYQAIKRQVAEARLLIVDRDESERLPVEVALRSLEVALARVSGDMPALVATATDVLGLLTTVLLEKLPSALQYRAVAINNKGVGLLWTGELDRADHYLRSGVMAARAAGVELVEINAAGHLAFVEFTRGALRDARRHAAAGRDLAHRHGWSSALQAVPVHTALAFVELEQNDLVEADKALRRAFTAHRSDPEAVQQILLRVGQARLLLAKGQRELAQALLRKLPLEADMSLVAPVAEQWLALVGAEIALMSGMPQRVRARIGTVLDDDVLADRRRVCLARADLALGDTRQAQLLLERVRHASTDIVATVEAWILTALLAEDQDTRSGGRAGDALAHAVALAAGEEIRRPFFMIDKPRLVALIERDWPVVPDDSQFLVELLAGMRPAAGQPVAPLVVELSSRELEVLRYLPTMYNAGEIAGELHVSVNTIKAHLRSIYRKLDVSRRREAVVRARGLGILG